MQAVAALEQLAPRRTLHVGCGGDSLPPWLGGEEVRLDIDPACAPDIVASMIDMGDIGEFEAVYCSHALEHLCPHDLPTALSEFLRVLRPGGVAIVVVPDLEDVRPTDEILYVSPAGPVAGLDMIYGLRTHLKAMPHMAHHNGFVKRTLGDALARAGFKDVRAQRLEGFNLMGTGVKP